MTLPALLLLAFLSPSAQEPPATAPATEATAVEPAEAASAPSASAGDPIQAGLALYKKRRFRQAAAEFKRAVELDPQSAAAHYYLGYSIYKIAEPRRANDPGKQEAAGHFARAYELNPNFKPTWKG
jgi:tetratricopeptide (TPR) repeat protein